MNFYSIKELENYSGIKAHTIRMWEKRYNLLDPERTDTNIRLYDDEQLLKLLNTATLLESGWKISKVSKLTKSELKESTTKCFDELSGENFKIPINALITAMFDFDEIEFARVLDTCNQKIGMYKTITQIVYPFLHRIGMMWRLEEISPAQEHFTSNIIRQKLISAINLLPTVNKPNGGFILFLPFEEFHEIGLLLSHYILKKKGHQVYYLGAHTTTSTLQVLINKRHPEKLVTFLVAKKPIEQINEYVRELSSTFKDLEIWVAGHRNIFRQLVDPPENCVFISSVQEFEDRID